MIELSILSRKNIREHHSLKRIELVFLGFLPSIPKTEKDKWVSIKSIAFRVPSPLMHSLHLVESVFILHQDVF